MTFHPFTVQCLTCGSRLRVTDPAIVGTIAACPQCQSMVQVETGGSTSPPQIAIGQSGIDSEAITETGISGQSLPPDVDSIGVDASLSDRPFAGQPTENSEPAVEAPPTISAPPAWQSSRSQKHKQIALIAVVAASGLLLSALIFGWFVSTWQTRSTASSNAMAPPIASDAPVRAPDEESTDPLTLRADASADPSEGSADTQDQLAGAAAVRGDDHPASSPATASDQESSSDRETSDRERSAGPVPPPASQFVDHSIPTDLVPQSPLSEPDAKTNPEPSDDPSGDDPSGDDPSGDDPSGDDPSAGAQSIGTMTATSEAGDSEIVGMTELPPELAKYTEILLKEGSLDVPTIAAPPTIDEVELDGPAEEEDVDLPRTQGLTSTGRSLNLQRDLGMDVAISTDGYPLADMMMLVSQWTTVPLQYDQHALEVVGIDLRQSIVGPKGMRSTRELIDIIAASIDCQWIPQPSPEQPSFLLLTPTDQRLSNAIDQLTTLDDFGTEKVSAANCLKEFLATRPDLIMDGTAAAENDPPTAQLPDVEKVTVEPSDLIAGQSHERRVWAAIAVDVLRRMRSIPPKRSEQQLLQSISAVQSSDKASVRLDWPPSAGREILVQTDTPISIAGIILRGARSVDARAMVDWPSVLRRGVGPETLLIPKPGANLDSVLSRWELPVRRIDDSLLWIGTDTAYDRQALIVWTPPLAVGRAIFSERIEVIQAAHPDEDVRMVYDPISDRAMLKLPRYMARQMPKILAK